MLPLIQEAVCSGARLEQACGLLGLTARTVQRWRTQAADGRQGPRQAPSNKLTAAERVALLAVVNSEPYRDLSPNQIVPLLADQQTYLASESTVYRVLREEGQLAHRAASKPAVPRPKPELEAAAPNRAWSWDITYLRACIRGTFFYLYLVMDLYSRKVVGWAVHAEESMELASQLIKLICLKTGVDPKQLVLHSDNGGPMKGSTMLATLNWLGIVASFSRPRVSDDNPFSEALFRTLKYRPDFPEHPFNSLEEATAWVEGFVRWYNTQHLHSGIQFVTPEDRHAGRDVQILAKRKVVYEEAKAKNPKRWSGRTRNWSPAGPVRLNPKSSPAADTGK
jgi:transposase InsO family protein